MHIMCQFLNVSHWSSHLLRLIKVSKWVPYLKRECIILFPSKVNGNSTWKVVPSKFHLPSFIYNQ